MEYFDTECSVLHLIHIVHEIFLENVCMLMFYVHGFFTFHLVFCSVCVRVIEIIRVQLNEKKYLLTQFGYIESLLKKILEFILCYHYANFI